MDPTYWEYDSANVEFITHLNVQAAKGKKGRDGKIFLKNQIFTNGTIEYDVELTGGGFPGIYFRMSSDLKNGENFYIRAFGPVSPETRTTLQYAAVLDGTSMWDLSDEYQAGATIYQQGWNHVRLVVSGKQMKAYVNDMALPVMVVPELESGMSNGTIYFAGGNVTYGNFVIKPNAIEDLNPDAGFSLTYNDSRYIRNWMVGPTIDFPFGKEVKMPLPSMHGSIVASDLPDSTTLWSPIKAESRGIVNLSRKFGHADNDMRRLAWLKTTIESARAQERILNLGFSDEVWVFVNGQIIYTDKNYFGTPSQKFPKSRCTLENSHFTLPLKEGKNEMLIGLANYFFVWGVLARLDDMDGIHLMK